WPNTRIRRVGLRASIVWSIGIWIFGQGMGGLFTGAGNWFTNAPGSALFYMLAAGLLLCESCWADGRVYVWMRRAFVALFLLSALLQAWPGDANWQLTTVTSWVQSMAAMKQPTLLSHILRICALGFALHPMLWNALFTIVLLALGCLWLFKPQQPLTYRATIVWLAYTWYVGQDFGVFGGLGTDPGSAVILALLLVGTRNVEGKGEVRG
ncbi:MAG: hypothetical protein OWT28_00800, partial [Firmicutes bacterium]|nr:hypothetical protein [Bacillota bacterium]